MRPRGRRECNDALIGPGETLLHTIHPDELYLLEQITECMTGQVKIDILRRERPICESSNRENDLSPYHENTL